MPSIETHTPGSYSPESSEIPDGIPVGFEFAGYNHEGDVIVKPISPEEKHFRMRRALLGGVATTLGIGGLDWTLLNGAITKRVVREILNKSQTSSANTKQSTEEGNFSPDTEPSVISPKSEGIHRPEIEITYIEEAKTDPRTNIQIVAKPAQEIEPRYTYSDKILPIPNGIKRAGFAKEIQYTCHWPSGPKYLHNALDIQGPKNGPIFTPADGIVAHVGYIYRESAQGNQVVIIYHPKYNLYCSYGHNNQAVVKVNQELKEGDQIARIGDQGYCTPGYDHIHWEIWRTNNFTGNPQNPWGENAQLINPEDFLQVLENNS